MGAGQGNNPSSGEQGPQSPAVDRQGTIANGKGIAYEVYSFNDLGQKKRHQVWREKEKAYAHLASLKKLYGTDIRAGVREVSDVKGNLFSQSVSKCRAILKAYQSKPIGKTASGKTIAGYPGDPQHKGFTHMDHMDAHRVHMNLHNSAVKNSNPSLANHHSEMAAGHRRMADKMPRKMHKAQNMPPVTGKRVGGIVTGSGKVMTGKSPKVTGKISGKTQIGTTKSGKAIHSDPGHEAHAEFSAKDHMDAYAAHAKQLSHMDAKETHPGIIEHHKQALNTHFKMGSSGMKKAVDACRALLK